MSITTHERPGVYSSYGASSLIRGSGGRKTVGTGGGQHQGHRQDGLHHHQL